MQIGSVRAIPILALLAAVLLAAAGPPQFWESPDTPDDPSPHSEATLISEVRTIQPGVPFTVGLRLHMDPRWHSYWENPGDSGEPTRIEWALPEGFEAGPLQWPFPIRIETGPFVTYGYEDEVLLPVELTPPADLAPGTTVTLAGSAHWLICEAICLPAEEEIELELPVVAGTPESDPEHAALFAEAQAMLPVEVEGIAIRATRSEQSYGIELTSPYDLPSTEGLHFFSADRNVIRHAAPQPAIVEGRTLRLAMERSEYATEPAERLRGILLLPEGEGWDEAGRMRSLAVDVPVEDEALASAAPGGSRASLSLLLALFFAFVGGVILNLMPCVFPVLSIKILSLARQSGDEPAEMRRHGLLFGAGVLVSFWVLAGGLIALRAGGQALGWGFQLQEPVFVGVIALLLFGVALSLAGVFEIGTSLTRVGNGGGSSGSASFSTGVLATVVATPCTAPFMGAALGYALAQPAWTALLVFTLLGLGMATPYVALAYAPGLLRRLPRPGPWMETFKQALAFPLFATVIWLVWVFGRQTGIDGVTWLLGAMMLLALAAWIIGHWPAPLVTGRTRLATRLVSALAVAGTLALTLVGATGTAPSEVTGESGWEAWTAEAVEAARAEGRPVFVDFTAAWCLTCQVNKRTTLSTGAVERAFEERDVARFRADWTNRSPEITGALDSFGRSGVPVYVLYEPSGEPVLLPEILTPEIVLEALEKLPDRAVATR